MKERGFYDRQWKASGDTNEKNAKRYNNKLMGDSPELMPLDSSLLGDLIEAIALNVVATGTHNQGERYSMGTPNEAWRTMSEVWEQSPTEERIIQDIDRFRVALKKNIAAEGTYVEEYDGRKGHRKATQKAIKGGSLIMTPGGVLADRALEGLQELISTWNGLTKPI